MYVLRELVPDPMAWEREVLAARKICLVKKTSYASAMTALRALPRNNAAAPVSIKTICQEFLKVLGRSEDEQPIICFRLCACAQFWRYQHYFLPLWEWGINKVVCFGLGSFRNVRDNGGPTFAGVSEKHTYRDVIRNARLLSEFNSTEFDRHDALQVMLRHIAAIEIASMLKFCSSRRGIEHQLIKDQFKKLTIIQNLPGSVDEISDKAIKKLEKLAPTAGYGGDKDLLDIPVYLHDPSYAEEDKQALRELSEFFELAHLPPVKVVDADQQEGYLLVDEHTLIYTVDPDFPVRSVVLGTSRPAAMIWRDHSVRPER